MIAGRTNRVRTPANIVQRDRSRWASFPNLSKDRAALRTLLVDALKDLTAFYSTRRQIFSPRYVRYRTEHPQAADG